MFQLFPKLLSLQGAVRDNFDPIPFKHKLDKEIWGIFSIIRIKVNDPFSNYRAIHCMKVEHDYHNNFCLVKSIYTVELELFLERMAFSFLLKLFLLLILGLMRIFTVLPFRNFLKRL